MIKPMLAKLGSIPFDTEDYAYEIKWDGLRAILYVQNGKIKILSRNLKDITSQYPELQELSNCFKGKNAILDGEIVILDKDNKPSFSLLQYRMGVVSAVEITEKMHAFPVNYIIFDLLYYMDESLLHLSYLERQKLLSSLKLSGSYWQTPGFKTQGITMLEATKKLNLEGIVAKRLHSTYLPGKRTGDWLKIKNQHRQELLIAGWVPGKGSRQGTLGSILTGYFDHLPAENDHQHLIYAGKVGTGFNRETLNKLKILFKPLEISQNPFNHEPPIKEKVIFLKPILIGEFEFTEWTPSGTMRHPSFKGLRQDKDPRFIVRE